MFLAQLAVASVIWAITIVHLVRNRDRMIAASERRTRATRAGLALTHLLISFAILGLTMLALAHGGLHDNILSWWGWPLVIVAGAAFVFLQTVALVPLVLNAVTTEPSKSSERKDSH